MRRIVMFDRMLGSGRPLIGGMPKSARLELLEARAFRSGNVLLRYARAG